MLSDPFILFIVLAPGIVALSGLFHKITGDRFVMALTTGTVLACGGLALYQLFQFAFGGAGAAEAHGEAIAHAGEHAGEAVHAAKARVIHLMTWMDVGGLEADWAIRVDALSITMMAVITSVAGLVHLYSWGYMSEEPHRARFFAYLSLFTFAMLMLVVADNFIQLFFGWEGVGLASYLLIGFWYQNKAPNDAAIKAFVTNRIGDFGLALGIMAVFLVFGTVKFEPMFDQIQGAVAQHGNLVAEYQAALAAGAGDLVAPPELMAFLNGALRLDFLGYSLPALEVIGVLLFIGAMGKSAQFFLHVWLPDAMEGPTPVSALIHAATMVTAGVYLVCLLSPVYEYTVFAAGMITVIGAITALYAATVGLAQNDIKRVIAYSTCSQLGYMFFAAGVGAYEGAMFHLFTHAFFKALLFLGAGSVIHGMHHEQDMRNMGGVRRFMPVTYGAMLIGTIAIIGIGWPHVWGFSGFFSKDAILESAFVAGQAGVPYGAMAFWFGIVAAALTSFYSWRLIYMTFHGPYTGAQHLHGDHDHGHDDAHADDHGHDHAHHDVQDPHESPIVMLVPLALLSLGAVFAGWIFYDPMFHHGEGFWGESIYRAASNHIIHDIDEIKHEPAFAWVFWAPVIITVAGFLVATFTYLFNRGFGRRVAASGGPLHALLYNKWYFDEIYNFLIVRPLAWLSDIFWKVIDTRLIDGLGPNGAAAASRWSARRLSAMHTGYLYHYAFVIIGAALVFGGVLYWRSGVSG